MTSSITVSNEIYEIRSKKILSGSSSLGLHFHNRAKAEEECAKLNKLLPNTYFVEPLPMKDTHTQNASNKDMEKVSYELGKITAEVECTAVPFISNSMMDSLASVMKECNIDENSFIRGFKEVADAIDRHFSNEEVLGVLEEWRALEFELVRGGSTGR